MKAALIGCCQRSGLGFGFSFCLNTLRPKLGAAGGVNLCH